ncbi:hypothetical protein L6164_001018 [Bauhinia variegata]|uniref:Uncharacterized protein n=1 Tax=Bauhinia variegata TaxID=167791 RepID=A0ACB9Q8A5_BAUVA|nr:hypothetical protein L6164_001018 [Bauhinia variegata]
MESKANSQGGKHVWLPEEDAALVECLVEMKIANKYVGDNGFKPGFLQHLETMRIEKLHGCGIKGNPHIQSRLKTLKNSWQAVYNMVQGLNTSGFGWDNDKNMVIADKAVWDEYLKKATPFRSRPFLHFDALCTIWAKDKAIGKDAQDVDNINEEANHVNFEESPDNVSEHQSTYDYDNDDTLSEVPETPRTRSSSGSRKKRKNDVAVDVLRDTIVTIGQSFQHTTENLCTEVHQLAHDEVMDERKEKLFEDLLKVQGLIPNEIYDAHMKLAQYPNLLVVFPTIPEPFKANWIRRLIW